MKDDILMKLIQALIEKKPENDGKKPAKIEYDYIVGENYFIRTVTHYLVGRLRFKTENELILDKCSWIADTGRYHDALRTGVLNEVEPYNPESLVHVNRGSFIDAVIWDHELPTEQK